MLDVSWLGTIVVELVTWYVTSHWFKTRSLPPGPFPLPIFGNLLSFRRVEMVDVMKKLREKYGGVFTVWFGSIPFVIVGEYRFITEALMDRRNDFSGRLQFPLIKKVLDGKLSISSSDYSRPCEILRKMGHSAIRKYAVSEHLPPVIDELTEETVKDLLKQKEPFDPKIHTHHLILNIIASSIFGQSYKKDDPMIISFRESLEVFQKYMNKGLMAYFMPILRPFFAKSESDMLNAMAWMKKVIREKMDQHIATYQPNDIRDMIDSILYARDELVASMGSENTGYLNDNNIFQVVMDIFEAGVNTTNTTVRWLMLYVTQKHPEIQEKIIREIRDNIGDRVPTQDDRKRCPYTSAVIMETMRAQTIAPFGLPHRTIRDTQIGGHVIRKGTAVMFHYGAVNVDPSQWKDPEKFIPERFLDKDGHLSDVRLSHYMPFGLGRRSCIGYNLATEDVFMVVAGIFKRCRLTIKDPIANTESQISFFNIPKRHTMIATPLDKE